MSKLSWAIKPFSPAVRQATVLNAVVAAVIWLCAPTSTVPGPMGVLSSLRSLWLEDALGREMLTSLTLNAEMLVALVLIVVPLGYARALPIARPVVALFANFRFLGLTGLTLLFTIYTSGSHSLRLSILVFSVGTYYLTALARIVDAVPTAEIDYTRTLGMKPWRSFQEILVRGRSAEMLEALRQNAAMGWMMLTAVEGLTKSDGGVGTLLLQAQRLWRLEDVYAIQLSLWVVGLLQDYLFGVARRVLFPYADLRAQR